MNKENVANIYLSSGLMAVVLNILIAIVFIGGPMQFFLIGAGVAMIVSGIVIKKIK